MIRLLVEKNDLIEECKMLSFPRISDRRGNLSVIEETGQFPFDIKRLFFLYDVPSGASRGGHAHKELKQVIIALSGSFDVILDDGITQKTVQLNRPHCGLFIPPGIWSELKNFSSNSIALSVASDVYKESDYIRDYEMFKKYAESGGLEKIIRYR
jgi:oxalate decarboxylase/phosphoglucose isomerase-like protein (cupin superfamily)